MKKLTETTNKNLARLCFISLFCPFSSAFAQSPRAHISFNHENCALLGHYASSSGNSLPKFRDNLLVPTSFFLFLTLGNGKRRQEISTNGCVISQKSASLISRIASDMSVRLSASKLAAPSGRISIKFYISNFHGNVT